MKTFADYMETVKTQYYASQPEQNNETTEFNEGMLQAISNFMASGKHSFDPQSGKIWDKAGWENMKRFLAEVKKTYAKYGLSTFEQILQAEIKKYANEWRRLPELKKQGIFKLVKQLDSEGIITQPSV